MFLDSKPFVYLWRPVHRLLFDTILWPFLGRVKTFFFLETRSDLTAVKTLLGNLELQNQVLMDRVTALETEQREQWNNIAKLLLCLYQNPRSVTEEAPNEQPSPKWIGRPAS